MDRVAPEVMVEHPDSDFGMDSMEIVRLLVEVEDSFGLEFDPVRDDLSALFSTPASLAGFLSARVEEDGDHASRP